MSKIYLIGCGIPGPDVASPRYRKKYSFLLNPGKEKLLLLGVKIA
jgi:hypothetical protein